MNQLPEYLLVHSIDLVRNPLVGHDHGHLTLCYQA
jgi:hypothetical protein